VIPPEKNAEFVCQMETVLDVYHEPYDPLRPVICFDEGSKQLIDQTRNPIPRRPGQPQRYDYEYERHGTCNIFMFFEPLAAWRHAEVTDHRKMEDFAHCMKWLVDEVHPEAHKIRVVLDNLNTHKPASLYEAFPPEKAHRLVRRIEFVYTPKHGSWLNMAEIELNALHSQCLDRRIPDKPLLIQEVAAWEKERNQEGATVNWQFTTQDARIKLRRLYPSFHA
jgi:hypothetical protein